MMICSKSTVIGNLLNSGTRR